MLKGLPNQIVIIGRGPVRMFIDRVVWGFGGLWMAPHSHYRNSFDALRFWVGPLTVVVGNPFRRDRGAY